MATTKLVLTPLTKALASLDRALARALGAPKDEELRDACIQRFEYCFELSWKMLKRRLVMDIANATEVDSYSRKTLFRVGAERGLIRDTEAWWKYLEARNLTSHTYDESKAREVFSVLTAFAADARDLLERLRERHD